MAITVTPQLTRITDADSTTGWSSTKVSGTGGTPAPVLDTEIFNQGTGSVSLVVNKTTMRLEYTTSTLNFNSGGGNEGDLLYVWAMVTTIGSTQPTSLGGVQIAVSDGSNWAYFYVNGSDKSLGGWQRYVIDPTVTPSSGSVNTASITKVAIMVDMGANGSKTANLFVDAIDVGRGLTVVGSDTSMWEAILAVDSAVANKYGIIRKDNGVYFVLGDLTLGDGATATALSASGDVVVWEDPQYYQAGFKSALGTDGQYTLSANAAGSSVAITLGDKVGSGDDMGGTNGCFIKSAGRNLVIDLSDSTVATLGIYGCTIQGVAGGVLLADNYLHEVAGTSFLDCGQLNSSSATVRGCVIAGYSVSASGAAIFTSLTDIKNTQFLSNSSGSSDTSAIELALPLPATLEFFGITFNGNDVGVRNNTGTSVTISITGGGSTPTVSDLGGSTTTVVNSVSVTFTGIVNDTEVRVYDSTGGDEVAGVEDSLGGSFSFSAQAGALVDIVLFHIQYDPVYLDDFSVPSLDSSIPIQQIFSRSYRNP